MCEAGPDGAATRGERPPPGTQAWRRDPCGSRELRRRFHSSDAVFFLFFFFSNGFDKSAACLHLCVISSVCVIKADDSAVFTAFTHVWAARRALKCLFC